MRPSLISEQRFDGAMRHTWRRPLPPIDQVSARVPSATVRDEDRRNDPPRQAAAKAKYPS